LVEKPSNAPQQFSDESEHAVLVYRENLFACIIHIVFISDRVHDFALLGSFLFVRCSSYRFHYLENRM